MINYLISENLKFKRTFSRKLMLLAPMFFILYAFLTMSNMETKNNYFLIMVFNWWPLIFMPIGSALLCSLSDGKERKSGNYRGLFSHNINITAIWFSKIGIIAYYMLLSSLLLTAVVYGCVLLFPNNPVPLLKVLEASGAVWLTSIGLIPVYLFFAVWLGTVAAMGISVFGIIAGVILAAKSNWFILPFSYSLRLMCPIMGVHPNGTALPADATLRNPSVIPEGILLSLLFFTAMTLLTAFWFTKRRNGHS